MKTGLGMEFFVDYAHLLTGHPKCGVPHGHTAKVIVELYGDMRPDGMIMDFKEMEEKCWNVLSQVDHNDLNEKFERPTPENITNWIFSELRKTLPIARVQFFEGQGKWCTVEA
ncbi:MAG TPA: 6-pyruvoyl tetrahydropterin synthase family protein [Nitrososphaerales archaeon]|nr:6-pyruvoyl tetrahydropterin synthase family protein [Nitrososphaerales archaeon]